ncbi:MAG: hypothetical protein AVDCRST_MAG95-275 [uncultured Adhaeribacter sp.]|uniref:Uncharacterized protein n=1 Tax=uncultured Adhaeribacter sp. TaxID=448109 RepID=A0A6J4H8Z9_9BACT|nr:MAG: hypothetical protein AVDCRST_MAG95-275 [uncultured Adhaeribacter sp.]
MGNPDGHFIRIKQTKIKYTPFVKIFYPYLKRRLGHTDKTAA